MYCTDYQLFIFSFHHQDVYTKMDDIPDEHKCNSLSNNYQNIEVDNNHKTIFTTINNQSYSQFPSLLYYYCSWSFFHHY